MHLLLEGRQGGPGLISASLFDFLHGLHCVRALCPAPGYSEAGHSRSCSHSVHTVRTSSWSPRWRGSRIRVRARRPRSGPETSVKVPKVTYSDANISSKASVEDGVLRIVIATEADGSSLDLQGIDDGTAALRSVHAGATAIGSILLIGRGPNFCAGCNVRDVAGAADRGAFVGSVADTFHAFVRELAAVTVPIVAGVHGWAAGAGMSLVCLTDIAIGGPSTKLRPSYPSIGFTPDGGMSWTLPRIVGSGRAMDILLNDSIINGEDAVRLGILSRLVGDDIIDSEAERLARTLAVGPTSAYRGIKSVLRASESASLTEQLDAEAASISVAASSPAGREGVDAFMEKRRPVFS